MILRGPDDEGYFVDRNAGLGMRRLKVIDLNTGHQPISNEDGRFWIVFNGEIYNYRELRSELEAKGHKFSTHSDTETIIHAYEEYGEDCVSKLNGMFAFAIWDRLDQKLFLSRDRLGDTRISQSRIAIGISSGGRVPVNRKKESKPSAFTFS